MSKVVLGFSGGVDSAVSAVLLQKAGHEVHGVYLDNAEESARLDAVSAAERMGIALTGIDVKRELEENVCRPFTEAYLRGETPNPVSVRSLSRPGTMPARKTARSLRACRRMTRAICSAA